MIFAAEFPSEGTYRLLFQFKASGKVHTAAFTTDVIELGAEPAVVEPHSTH